MYKLILIILLTLSFFTIAESTTKFSKNDDKIILQLEEDEVAIFGYGGSLMFREPLLDPNYKGPYIQAKLRDFKRSWSIIYPNYYQFIDENDEVFIPESTTSLNAEPALGSIMNGMIFVCSKSELESYDLLEYGFNRIKISDQLENVCVLGGDAFVYSAKPEYFFPSENRSKEETVIQRYYIDIIEEAIKVQGEEFAQDYRKSTQVPPSHLVCEIALESSSFPTMSETKSKLSHNGEKMVLQLAEDEVAIFGYGSLMLRETLHDPWYTGPFFQAKLRDFKRSWSVIYPNDYKYIDENGEVFIPESITALNVEPALGSIVNGMIFVCSKSELESYDQRENSYNRIKINDQLENVCVLGGDAFVYSAKPEYFFPSENRSKEETVIQRSYTDLIEKALKVQGEEFAQDYRESTQVPPSHLVCEFARKSSYFPAMSETKSRLSHDGEKMVLQLDEDEVAIFGYGSLMLRKTLHDPWYTGPFFQAKLRDFKRSWSIIYPNVYEFEFIDENGEVFIPENTTPLNVEPAPGSIVNGMIFICSKSELDSYDRREYPYNRIKINDQLENVSVLGGDVFVYSAKPEYYFPSENRSKEETVIKLSYIDIIEKALEIQGKEFAREYRESTQVPPSHLVFDLEESRQEYGMYKIYTQDQSKIKYGFSKEEF